MKKFCRVVFDRKNKCSKTGRSAIEIIVSLTHNVRKYIIVKRDVTPAEWAVFEKSKEAANLLSYYQGVVESMFRLHQPLTIENLDKNLGIESKEPAKVSEKEEKETLKSSFLDFMYLGIYNDQIEARTKDHRMVALRSLKQFGKIKTFADLTPNNISKYDDWLRSDPSQPKRSDTTIKDYHKTIHRYVMRAFERGIIERDPYRSVTIKHGKNKERTPLVEEELLVLRNLHLTGKLEKVRDLFIFAAYTGMAYVEVMNFDFFTMTEQKGNLFYIESKRAKTDSKFFTPILPPAMAILKKYKFRLPKISNQKVNDYLHLLEEKANIHKPMTFHVARHSFATMVLSHDVPIEKVSRMLGHKDVKTTQIYAKVLKNTIYMHSDRLLKEIL